MDSITASVQRATDAGKIDVTLRTSVTATKSKKSKAKKASSSSASSSSSSNNEHKENEQQENAALEAELDAAWLKLKRMVADSPHLFVVVERQLDDNNKSQAVRKNADLELKIKVRQEVLTQLMSYLLKSMSAQAQFPCKYMCVDIYT